MSGHSLIDLQRIDRRIECGNPTPSAALLRGLAALPRLLSSDGSQVHGESFARANRSTPLNFFDTYGADGHSR